MSGWGSYEFDSIEGKTITDILESKGLAFVLRRCRDYAAVKASDTFGLDKRVADIWWARRDVLDELIGNPQSRW